jgi:glycosyltransferase involved in cell wall biosynthesis
MNRSLRVTMILQSYYPRIGGAERQVAALAPLLRERGVEVSVITRRYAGFAPFETLGGVPVYRVATPGPKPVASLAFTLGALPLIARLKPDVIHAHELLSPATTALAAKALFGTPLAVKILRGGTLGDVAKVKKRRNARAWFANMQRNIRAFIVISAEIERELDEIGIPLNQRYRIPNGVDTGLYRPADSLVTARAKLGLAGGPVAIFAGRLDREKRLDLLVAAWPAIRSHYPAATLVLVGDGTEAENLRRNAPEGVHFIGRVDNTAPYLQAADVFVLPSETEGLSNALLEAMAAGLAVIATDVGGVRDVVTDRSSGRIIPPMDAAALELALLELFADAETCQRYGSSARARILQDYALPATADKLRVLYDKLLAEKR